MLKCFFSVLTVTLLSSYTPLALGEDGDITFCKLFGIIWKACHFDGRQLCLPIYHFRFHTILHCINTTILLTPIIMNPLKAPPSLLHGFGVPTVGNSNSSLLLGNNSNKKRSVSAISQTPKARTVSLGGEADLFLKTPTTPSQASGDALLLPSASEASPLA